MEIIEELEIHQNTFKCLLYNISEVYPSKFNYIHSVLSLIKNRIKPETLNGLCDYYSKVKNFLFLVNFFYLQKNETFSIAKLAKFIQEELTYIPAQELTINSYMNSKDLTVNYDNENKTEEIDNIDICAEIENDDKIVKESTDINNEENETSIDLDDYEIIFGEKDDF